MVQAGLDVESLGSQGYHTAASVVVSHPAPVLQVLTTDVRHDARSTHRWHLRLSRSRASSALCAVQCSLQVLLLPGVFATALHISGALLPALQNLQHPPAALMPAAAAVSCKGGNSAEVTLGIPATRPREPRPTNQGLPQGVAKALAALSRVSPACAGHCCGTCKEHLVTAEQIERERGRALVFDCRTVAGAAAQPVAQYSHPAGSRRS